MGTMGCHTKQMRLRGVLGMGRLRVRRCHRRRAEWYREFNTAIAENMTAATAPADTT
ncbi:hypothetical protein C361_04643 [Cryptococcus neoformans Tu259-1]|uniref:Uncharacterized protein n=1 Tax=Cryptococcus neoformans Tu259-1 TaxID=1230072 RepID=A0A854QA43_CRYNE|nr:hypothetical protein C361_04643 [Cryptococcus neoformans var. grubii Tu259-1]OXG61312.1 hypothetical protein C351_04221 [Cryptococcus neoformans var. grubii c8]OXH07765.1 hypothetical protein C369_04311 [Cryptococcus neoformans var. grubii A5-35-17]